MGCPLPGGAASSRWLGLSKSVASSLSSAPSLSARSSSPLPLPSSAAATTTAPGAVELEAAHAFDAQQRQPLPAELRPRLTPADGDGFDDGAPPPEEVAALVGADGVPFSPFARDYRGLREAIRRGPIRREAECVQNHRKTKVFDFWMLRMCAKP